MPRHVDETTATIWVETDAPCTVRVFGAETRTFTVHGHHYGLVDVVGLAPRSSTPYKVHLDGEQVWPEPGSDLPGKLARDTPISVRHHARTVVDLRGFFDDITAWRWVEAPLVLLLHRSDIPRLPRPLPRALAPDVDTALMTAVAGLHDVAARAAITVLRGTGLRLGELLDLELNCCGTSLGTGPG